MGEHVQLLFHEAVSPSVLVPSRQGGRVVLQATPIMGSPAAPSRPGPCTLVEADWPWTGDLPSSGWGEQGRREGTDADRRDCLAQGPASCNHPRNGFVNLLGVAESFTFYDNQCSQWRGWAMGMSGTTCPVYEVQEDEGVGSLWAPTGPLVPQ